MNGVVEKKVKMSYLSNPSMTPLCGLTIGQLIDRSAAKYGPRDGLIVYDGNIRRTFAELKTEIDNLAAGLLDLGLVRGDRLACIGPNSHFAYLTQMATWKAGLVLVGSLVKVFLHAYCTPSEILYSVKHTGAKCLVVAEPHLSYNYYEMAIEVIPEIVDSEPGQTEAMGAPELTTVITMELTTLKGAFTLDEIMKRGTKSETKTNLANALQLTQMDDICSILLTSGTTGNSKGVMLSHHNMINSAIICGKRWGYSQGQGHDKLCLIPQISHMVGGMYGSMLALYFGTTCVLPSKTFDAKAAVTAISKEKCTAIYAMPHRYIEMLDVVENYDMSSLRLAIMFGVISSEKVVRRMMSHFTNANVTIVFGTTETCAIFSSSPNESLEMRWTTVGYPIEGTEIKIVDKSGQILPRGVAGEACIRGPSVTRGYWGNPEKTAEAIDSANWFHTGDIMIMQENGYATSLGRVKDLITIGGESVYPQEVEVILQQNQKIKETYGFGVPDSKLGEVVGVWVQLKENVDMSESEVKKFCAGKIEYYKIPAYVVFVKQLIETSSGKPQRNKMRDHILTRKLVERATYNTKRFEMLDGSSNDIK